MDKQSIIQQTADMIKQKFADESSGHDRWHIHRVWQNAKHIAQNETCDMFIVELATLLHDIADWKFHNGDEEIWPQLALQWLESLGIDKDNTKRIIHIIKNMSFRWGKVQEALSIEWQIVQDADRLDALGAIGISRAFATGAKLNRIIHDPDFLTTTYDDPKEYKKAKEKRWRTTIGHFHEKLLLLKDRMNTATGKEIAEHRHQYMEWFLAEFLAERDGIR